VTALGDLTWPEAERLAAAGAVLAVPVGSTEQHGPHLPLSTDTDVAVALAVRLAARRAASWSRRLSGVAPAASTQGSQGRSRSARRPWN
jgi:creatinine amidohydrolase/Fe(II)-dependent formamide hydrolase-like protein